jgi:hypothetical protein
MPDDLSADDIISLLKLEPNATCGFVRVTFLSTRSIAPADCRIRLAVADLWDLRFTSW